MKKLNLESLRPVDEHPLVVPVLLDAAAIADERKRLESERREAWAIGGFTNQYTIDPVRHATEAELLRARLVLSRSDDELRELRLREIAVEQRLEDARKQARAEMVAVARALQTETAKALGDALSAASKVNETAVALDERVARVLGNHFQVRVSWHELVPETPTVASRLSTWRRVIDSELHL